MEILKHDGFKTKMVDLIKSTFITKLMGYDLELITDINDEVKNFIKANNLNGTDNITLLEKKLLNGFLTMGGGFLNLRRSGKLLGCILGLNIPIYCKHDKKEKYGLLTFLCVDKEERGKGIAKLMSLTMKNIGEFIDIKKGYYIGEKKLSENALPLNSWYYLINKKKSKLFKFDKPDTYDDEIYPNIKCLKVKNDIFLKQSHKFLTDSGKDLFFFPSEKKWKSWTENFDTYMIVNCSNDEILGLFTTINSKEIISDNMCRIKYVIFNLGDGKLIRDFCISSVKNADLIYFYEIGDLTQNILIKRCTKFEFSNLWLSFYSDNNKHDIKNISIPLF